MIELLYYNKVRNCDLKMCIKSYSQSNYTKQIRMKI
jgi:hypothetical protein